MGVPLSGYRDFRLLRASARARVYEAKRERDEARVVAKVFQVDDPGVEARVEHEFRLVQRLALEGVVRAIGLERSGDELVLLFEQVPGVNLEQFAAGRPLDVAVFLPIALALADTLARIHDERILHRDIKPSNLLIEPESGRVYFADFGISVLLESQRRHLYDPDVLEGTLPYISPEQTGRTKRAVDFRSDLYSLGASFYELLTGHRPFELTTPLELIHAHLARRPRPLTELGPELPSILSDMVLRLLEKAPEHRYQSARGLHVDLCRLADALAAGQGDPRFPLGHFDHATTLQLPHQLYGREHELEVLERELGEVGRLGAARLVLVGGEPGLGKSALIHALETPLLGRGGRMGVGKFELDARELPFGGFVAAFTSLVEQILTESEARLTASRERLAESLGPIAGAVAELVPGLSLILGELPELPELEPVESRNRLHLALARFLAILAETNPLVLVLDDAQWADAASLELLRVVLEEGGELPVLFIVTYRRDEVDEAHPLARLRERLSATLGTTEGAPPGQAARITALELEPLSPSDLRTMLAAILGRPRETVEGLAELVTRKTENNPLFVRQFLLYLAELGLLRPSVGGWVWDEQAIAAAGIPDDVLAVMAAKIGRLPEGEREVLQQAACIGSRFDASILASIGTLQGEALAASLYRLEVEGLIGPVGRDFQFNHDRIQEAAYSLLAPDQQRSLHWAIGRCLLERANASDSGSRRSRGLGTSGPSLGDRVFEIVDQLDAGLDHTAALDREGRLELARLNLQAGERALVSAAWTAAERYLELARELTRDERARAARGEGDERELSFAIEFAHAQAVELSGELEVGQRAFDTLLAWPLSAVEHGRVVARRIHLLDMHGRHEEAIAIGLAGLERYGLRVPARPSLPRALSSLMRGWRSIRKFDLERLLALPEVADERIDAAMHIITPLAATASSAAGGMNLYVYLVGLHARLIARYGFHATATTALTFPCAVVAGMGKVQEASVLCEHVLALAERRPSSPSARVHALSAVLLFVWPHSRPFRQIADQLEHVHQLALEVGDIDSAGYIAAFGLTMHFDAGTHMRSVFELHARFARANPTWGVSHMAAAAEVARRMYETLGAGEGEPSPGFFASEADESSTATFYGARIFRSTGLVLLGDLEQARAVFQPIARDFARAILGTWVVPRTAMIGAIVEAEHALRPEASAGDRWRAIRRLRGWRKLTRTWATNCPINYGAVADVVVAELAALRGRSHEVYDALEQARMRAAEQGAHYLEAIASERLAVHARRFGHSMLAEGALRRAHTALYRWGARAALQRLELQYPELSSRPIEVRDADRSTTSRRHSSDTSLLHVDFTGVIDTLQTISEELRLDVVIPRVLGSAMASAGADHGALLLEQAEVLGLVAEARAEQAPEFIEPAIPISELGARLATSAVRLALRTGSTLVIDDASADPRFAGDPFVLESGARSLLCMPIVKHSRRVGALVLANRLSSHAFTAERLEVLRLLTAQAARALDNASVYAELERSEARWRTLVSGVPDIIMLLDAEGRIEFINHLAPFDNARSAALIGTHAYTHIVPACGDDWQRTFDEVLAQGKMGEVEVQIDPKHHQPRWYTIRLAPIEIGGRVGKVISIATDITDRRQAEAARARLEAQLRQQQRLESIGTLASGVAHEINNPIQGIMNYAELIDERPGESESVREFAREIRIETDRVATIVRNLLAFSRQEREQQLEAADVRQLVDTTLSLIRAVLRKEQIQVAVDVPADLPKIGCRVQQIQQIVMNLVTNARDALNDRYPEFSVDKRIDLRARAIEREGQPWVRISVEDRGVGIPEAIRSRIFDPFFTTKRHDKGTGLGLALSHGIAAEHGGELWVESEAGAGTTFHLDLPGLR